MHKVFAGRDRDWADVEGILTRQHGKLDLGSATRRTALSAAPDRLAYLRSSRAPRTSRRAELLAYRAGAAGTRTARADAASAKTTAARTWKAVA